LYLQHSSTITQENKRDSQKENKKEELLLNGDVNVNQEKDEVEQSKKKQEAS